MALTKAQAIKRCMFCGESYRDTAAHLEKQCWKMKKETNESNTDTPGDAKSTTYRRGDT